MTKLNVVYIEENEEDWLPISLESVKWADSVFVIDGFSKDSTTTKLKEFRATTIPHLSFIQSTYEHESKQANGIQRNKYLDYMKKYHMGEWCLVLDADEVLSDNAEKEIKKNIEDVEKGLKEDEDYAINIRMIHLISDFQNEDSTQQIHRVPRRLFRISEHLFYPLVEHPVLQSKRKLVEYTVDSCEFWHYAYAKGQLGNLNKYLNHLAKSNIHQKGYLRNWYLSHLLGSYPRRRIDPLKHPSPIKKKFLLEQLSDEVYFAKRMTLETKHLIDAIHWKKAFNPKKVLVCGDGMGHRIQSLRVLDVEAGGFDISEYAVTNNVYKFPEGLYWEQDILEAGLMSNEAFDLVIAYDILEHLEEKDLSTALKNIHGWGNKHYVFSIPFLGDPNLNADPTHKIKKSRAWWIEQIQKAGIKIVPTPDYFLYQHQLLVGTKK